MADQTDTLVVTGPDFFQLKASNLAVTPLGGVQTTLANALANPVASSLTIAAPITGTFSLADGEGYGIATITASYTTGTSLAPSSTLNSLQINHSINGGEAAHNAINAFITNVAPTTGSGADGHAFYAGVFSTNYVNSGDGGGSGTEKGDFYGYGGGTFLTANAKHIHGALGAEFDLSVPTGASVLQNMILQLSLVASHAVQGSQVDAAIVIDGDNTITAGLKMGIQFGRSGAQFTATGTMIGTQASVNSLAAVNGLDLSAVTFSGNSLSLPGFSVNGTGQLTTTGVAFASLPGSPVAGTFAYITDSDTATWGATVAGAGSNKILAWYNGSNWTVVGK